VVPRNAFPPDDPIKCAQQDAAHSRAGVLKASSRTQAAPRIERQHMNTPRRVTNANAISRVAVSLVLALAVAGEAGCSGLKSQGTGAPQPGDVPAPAKDAAVRKTPVTPGRPARVFVFAGFGDHCEQVPAPEIAVTQAPTKGDLSFVKDQETTIQYSAQGTCIGQTAKGTGIYYTARAGQDGVDRFSVSAKLATGETATRTFEVRIAE
jgi:hypothetical protein